MALALLLVHRMDNNNILQIPKTKNANLARTIVENVLELVKVNVLVVEHLEHS